MSPFVLVHPNDNVLICIRDVAKGQVAAIEGEQVTFDTAIPLGHKIARRRLSAGEKVIRYGVPIGSMVTAAQAGEHVHMHNLKSDYIPAHDRGAVHGKDAS